MQSSIHETGSSFLYLYWYFSGISLVFEVFAGISKSATPHNLIEKILIQTVGHILCFFHSLKNN